MVQSDQNIGNKREKQICTRGHEGQFVRRCQRTKSKEANGTIHTNTHKTNKSLPLENQKEGL